MNNKISGRQARHHLHARELLQQGVTSAALYGLHQLVNRLGQPFRGGYLLSWHGVGSFPERDVFLVENKVACAVSCLQEFWDLTGRLNLEKPPLPTLPSVESVSFLGIIISLNND